MNFRNAKELVEKYFNGQYEVKKFLGEGSFARVYLVKHNFLDDLRAMKIVKEPLNEITNTRDVFHEVMLATQLRHENIISIYDAGVISSRKDYAYFVMEYVPGGDLEQYLNSFIESDISMPINRVLDIIKQISMGLNTLHQSNPPIIHRDLKLNNILLSYGACGEIAIKISDFGFAKEVTANIQDIEIAGTQPYMAPEYFKKVISTRSDIYAIGVIFYRLLTAHFPYDVDKFETDDLRELKPWKSPLMAPSHYNNRATPELDRIISKCLDVDPDERYQNAAELLGDIEFLINQTSSVEIIRDEDGDEDVDYVINGQLEKAFQLAKCENGLNEAIEILESEIFRHYDVRQCYSETLRMWKSAHPDVKLISKAFTVNLYGKNYPLSCSLVKEAIAFRPGLKNRYWPYIELWHIFIDLEKNGNLIRAVLDLEELMESDINIREIYGGIINILKTYSVDEIVNEAIRLVNLNNLTDGANLMEFAVVCDSRVRQKYAYKLYLWKQNMKMHFRRPEENKADTIDYAIDLGTTDSVISYYNNGNPIIIKNHRTGEDFTPSAVLIDENDNIDVGANAIQAILENNHNAVSEFKHNMGFPIPFEFEKSSRVMFPEELSAEVLKDLRVSVYEESGVNMEHAVICVPANSNPLKTRALNEAAKLAGFKSHSILLEPIAAALAYDLKKDNAIWMIYDLGGGTFNVSLIRDNGGELEKIATMGLDNFGGNAIDWKIVEDLFVPRIVEDLDLDDFQRDNPKYQRVFAKLKSNAEISKKNLTESDRTYTLIPGLFENYDFTYCLNRNLLNEIIGSLLEHTFNLCHILLNDNSLSVGEIDKIILVGGSTLSPIVQELVAGEFETEIESGIDPLTVVARGAAVYAGSLEKPKFRNSKEPLSILLECENDGKINGKVFSNDLRPSFLGCHAEFNNGSDLVKVPLNIDGEFSAELDFKRYDIHIYRNGEMLLLDEKSPDSIAGDKMYIPYFGDAFSMKNDSDADDLTGRYSSLVRDIDYLNEYSRFRDWELQEYLENLIQIAVQDRIALNQTELYLDYLDKIVKDLKKDLEFSVLLNNVLNKIDVVNEKNLFEVKGIDEIMENRDLDRLKQYYSDLVEKYVLLNRDDVVKECFFNLKYDGIYINNRELADELINEGKMALNSKDYEGLLEIINRLYELDERIGGGII